MPHKCVDARRAYHKQYAEKHKEELRSYKSTWHKQWRNGVSDEARYKMTNREKAKLWRERHPGHYAEKVKERRLRVISKYGGNCQCCHEDKMAFLTIDHVNGKGREDRLKVNNNFYGTLDKSETIRTDLRVLCMNCNWATRFGKRCPHAT